MLPSNRENSGAIGNSCILSASLAHHGKAWVRLIRQRGQGIRGGHCPALSGGEAFDCVTLRCGHCWRASSVSALRVAVVSVIPSRRSPMLIWACQTRAAIFSAVIPSTPLGAVSRYSDKASRMAPVRVCALVIMSMPVLSNMAVLLCVVAALVVVCVGVAQCDLVLLW